MNCHMSAVRCNLEQEASGSLEQNEPKAETSSSNVVGDAETYNVYILE